MGCLVFLLEGVSLTVGIGSAGKVDVTKFGFPCAGQVYELAVVLGNSYSHPPYRGGDK